MKEKQKKTGTITDFEIYEEQKKFRTDDIGELKAMIVLLVRVINENEIGFSFRYDRVRMTWEYEHWEAEFNLSEYLKEKFSEEIKRKLKKRKVTSEQLLKAFEELEWL